ncbi:hypothetical protein LCL96_07960 [Rossellomorea aquimaris]|uniref:hypothetical protein n=1 Tax=Rossellomorea aquimaris TaxID=189382 RepID=UPI001CD67E14|nr:hypothetical protein [Rossellomorea aquimaris]MCA1058865.1 hypothetical protein [Rossellomorea aquimaris]
MSLKNIETMLKTLKEFKESEIVHTISDYEHSPIMTVTYHSDTESFQITYVESMKVEIYTDISLLATTIERILLIEVSN